jgi:hypothetical protein
MAVVLIDFDLPDFQDSFTWEGDQSTAIETVEVARQMAARAGFDPPGDYPLYIVAQAPLQLNDPRKRREAQAVIAAFVMQLPTEDIDYPGAVADYLTGHDVAVTIRETQGLFTCRLGFVPQKDIAGSNER